MLDGTAVCIRIFTDCAVWATAAVANMTAPTAPAANLVSPWSPRA